MKTLGGGWRVAEKHLSPLPSLLLVAYLAANESLGLQLTAAIALILAPRLGLCPTVTSSQCPSSPRSDGSGFLLL